MELAGVGNRIQKAREKAHITQEELAKAIGCTPQHVSAIERGVKTPRLDTFVKIAKVLRTSADTLLQDVLPCPEAPMIKEFASTVGSLPYCEIERILMVVKVLADSSPFIHDYEAKWFEPSVNEGDQEETVI